MTREKYRNLAWNASIFALGMFLGSGVLNSCLTEVINSDIRQRANELEQEEPLQYDIVDPLNDPIYELDARHKYIA